jgi:predicted Rossmann fold nucleotide-binding protein DprA/Smf involved in DNA uptake
MTTLSNNTLTTLLLTTRISKAVWGDPEPLDIREWNDFSGWMSDRGLQGEDLLTGDIAELLKDWKNEKCPPERIQLLLKRGASLAPAVEKWQRVGIWFLLPSDSEYPGLLKERLKDYSPPVLFGCGNKGLLNSGGIGIVGSRDANNEDLGFARDFGKKIADSGISVISGGDRGIDKVAMLSALEKDGRAVGILADNLFKAILSQKYRPSLKNQNLVLISTFSPESEFTIVNSVARNKYIYCLSDASVIVHSGRTGGTWNAAMENLKKGWAPLWVKKTTDKLSGNELLVRNGAEWLPQNILSKIDFNEFFIGRNLPSAFH